jgi:hypothetical protein
MFGHDFESLVSPWKNEMYLLDSGCESSKFSYGKIKKE